MSPPADLEDLPPAELKALVLALVAKVSALEQVLRHNVPRLRG